MRRYADINVTPLIDVLLVLLIIFMAALPLTQKGLDASLPQPAPPTAPAATPPGIIVLEYKAAARSRSTASRSRCVTCRRGSRRSTAIARTRRSS